MASAIKSDASPRSKDRACWELTDPVDVGHPALFRVSRFPMPDNEESDENPDQRCNQEELAHKTASMLYLGKAGRSARERPGTNRIREASRWQRNTLGTCCGLINSVSSPSTCNSREVEQTGKARRGDLIDVQVLNEPRVVIEVRHTKLVADDLT